MGDDIDDINATYVEAGKRCREFILVPSWWTRGDITREQQARMVGIAVEYAQLASAGQSPPIRSIEVRRDGIHLHVETRPGRTEQEQEQVNVLLGRIESLGRFPDGQR